jgi:hypothetical protein
MLKIGLGVVCGDKVFNHFLIKFDKKVYLKNTKNN